ncbi:MAG TPA: hypothetical protein VFI15_02125 [Candidatus Limnocylindrales bacterium]|nr:hypothetical protein [Candidatus Limnocylindrales bacterium]
MRLTRSRILVVVAAGAIAVGVGFWGATGAHAALACGPTGEISEADQSYTPYALMRGHAQELPIGSTGSVADSPATSVDGVSLPAEPKAIGGLPLQLVIDAPVMADASGTTVTDVRAYYASFAPGGLTIDEFLSKGGIVLSFSKSVGRDANVVVATIGKRATLVGVESFNAALVHADPLEDGTRPYRLYWSDGQRDGLLMGAVSPSVLVDQARALYCS